MQITKITIGRLFNLGNYEHVRYELTVEMPDGESAAQALRSTEILLDRLNPKRPDFYLTKHQSKQAELQIQEAHALTDRECRNMYGIPKYARIKRMQDTLQARIAQSRAWDNERNQAMLQLDNLGGVLEFNDAKKDWQDDYQD